MKKAIGIFVFLVIVIGVVVGSFWYYHTHFCHQNVPTSASELENITSAYLDTLVVDINKQLKDIHNGVVVLHDDLKTKGIGILILFVISGLNLLFGAFACFYIIKHRCNAHQGKQDKLQ